MLDRYNRIDPFWTAFYLKFKIQIQKYDSNLK